MESPNSKLAPHANKVLETYHVVSEEDSLFPSVVDLLELVCDWSEAAECYVTLELSKHTHYSFPTFCFYVAEDIPARSRNHLNYDSLEELMSMERMYLTQYKHNKDLLCRRFDDVLKKV